MSWVLAVAGIESTSMRPWTVPVWAVSPGSAHGATARPHPAWKDDSDGDAARPSARRGTCGCGHRPALHGGPGGADPRPRARAPAAADAYASAGAGHARSGGRARTGQTAVHAVAT